MIKTQIVENFLKWMSSLLILLGAFILVFFLVRLSNYYSIIGSDPLLLPETGQVGDFIGGLVGSLWTLASVLLFYLAIRLQTKEIGNQISEMSNQNKTLELQREEFETNRVTQIIFHQIRRIDDFMNNFKIRLSIREFTNAVDYSGYGAVDELNNRINPSPHSNSNANELSLSRRIDTIDEAYNDIQMLLDIYISSSVALRITLDISESLSALNKNNLKRLFFENVNPKSIQLIKSIANTIDLSKEKNITFNHGLTEMLYMRGIIDTFLAFEKKLY